MVDIKSLRKLKNLDQEQLARLVGVSRQAISNIECGITKPSVENAKKLGEILGFDWTEFYANV